MRSFLRGVLLLVGFLLLLPGACSLLFSPFVLTENHAFFGDSPGHNLNFDGAGWVWLGGFVAGAVGVGLLWRLLRPQDGR